MRGRILLGTFGLVATVFAGLLCIPPVQSQTASPLLGVVVLGYRVAQPSVDPVSEDVLLDLLNNARRQHGLALLRMNSALRAAARAHSQDMAARGYFGHISISGQTLGDRIGGIVNPDALIAENIVISQTVDHANAAFTASSGHRQNILEPRFRYVGIGVADAGKLGMIVTEDFSE